jgi:hypothetical protein
MQIATAGTDGKSYRDAYVRMFFRQNFTFGLTLNWNRRVSLERARADLSRCFRDVDRAVLGQSFNRSREGRTEGVFAFEHVASNIHCHGMIKVLPRNVIKVRNMFLGERSDIWSNVVPSGTHMLKILSNPIAAANYMLKDQTFSADSQTLVWLSDFWPA